MACFFHAEYTNDVSFARLSRLEYMIDNNIYIGIANTDSDSPIEEEIGEPVCKVLHDFLLRIGNCKRFISSNADMKLAVIQRELRILGEELILNNVIDITYNEKMGNSYGFFEVHKLYEEMFGEKPKDKLDVELIKIIYDEIK